MAVKLPNGIIFSLGTTLGAPKPVTAITNANPAVASSATHGLSNGAVIVVNSGWQKINDRVMRVAAQASGTFNLEGIDTTSTTLYPAGSGTGSVREVTGFTQISQVLESSTSGGEMQFATYSFLENDFESQIPTQSSAQTITLNIADDDTLAGYKALQKASDERVALPLKAQLPDGAVILYMGYVSFNSTPSMTKGEVMACEATFSLLSKPVRYSA